MFIILIEFKLIWRLVCKIQFVWTSFVNPIYNVFSYILIWINFFFFLGTTRSGGAAGTTFDRGKIVRIILLYPSFYLWLTYIIFTIIYRHCKGHIGYEFDRNFPMIVEKFFCIFMNNLLKQIALYYTLRYFFYCVKLQFTFYCRTKK